MDHEKQAVIKCRDYISPDGDIFMRVENGIFWIDEHFLTKESTKLKSEIGPIIPSCDPPGSSEMNALVLGNRPSAFSINLWKQILNLAHYWGIAWVVKLCIGKLSKLIVDPVERIELYQKLNLSANLLQSFVELTIRPQPLSIEEGVRLGLNTCLRLAQARERARDPDKSRLQPSNVEEVIEEVFGLQGTPPSAAASPLRENPMTDEHVDKGDKGGKRKKSRHGASHK